MPFLPMAIGHLSKRVFVGHSFIGKSPSRKPPPAFAASYQPNTNRRFAEDLGVCLYNLVALDVGMGQPGGPPKMEPTRKKVPNLRRNADSYGELHTEFPFYRGYWLQPLKSFVPCTRPSERGSARMGHPLIKVALSCLFSQLFSGSERSQKVLRIFQGILEEVLQEKYDKHPPWPSDGFFFAPFFSPRSAGPRNSGGAGITKRRRALGSRASQRPRSWRRPS